jgi:hypothetical protein
LTILKKIFSIFLIGLFSSCSLLKHSPGKSYNKALDVPYDAVIIPGFPHDGKKWNDVIKFRLLWAVHLYENQLAKNFIFSGGSVHTPYNEGMIMALYAAKMGIPKENIFIEPRARHSSENVYYSLQVAEELNFKRVAVATDPVQGFLLTNYTERIRDQKIHYINLQPKKIRPTKHPDEPKIDFWLAYNDDFTPLSSKKKYWERKKESLGLDIDYKMKPSEYLKFSKWFEW